jgi:hypothetical protein
MRRYARSLLLKRRSTQPAVQRPLSAARHQVHLSASDERIGNRDRRLRDRRERVDDAWSCANVARLDDRGGLRVTSHDPSALNTARISNVVVQ